MNRSSQLPGRCRDINFVEKIVDYFRIPGLLITNFSLHGVQTLTFSTNVPYTLEMSTFLACTFSVILTSDSLGHADISLLACTNLNRARLCCARPLQEVYSVDQEISTSDNEMAFKTFLDAFAKLRNANLSFVMFLFRMEQLDFQQIDFHEIGVKI